jgi:hypothetical protein
LIIVALVAAWLLVLVPIVARRRQEVARTADSALAARVVRSGGVSCSVEEEFSMSDSGDPDTARDRGGIDYADELDEFDEELEGLGDADEEAAVAEPDQVEPDAAEDDFADEAGYDDEDDLAGYDDAEYDDVDYDEYEDERGESRPYRPGRGGFDPEAAALTARAKYANRQRVVVFILVLAVVSALAGGLLMPLIWWVHGIVDATFVGYLTYLRRQVRIEEEIRDRRTARMGGSRRAPAPARQRRPRPVATEQDAPAAPRYQRPVVVAQRPHPGTVVVEADDEDPMFDELDEPDVLPYRRAVGE